ncbi:MAG: glycosyltransferase family 4 protein [Candidatus Limnocylindria bacterium]
MNRALRVVHLNDLAFSGSQLVAGMRQRGIEAHLIDPARRRRGPGVARRMASLPIRIGALLAAAARARRLRPDIVHLHYARMGWLAALIGRPFVLTCHGTDIRGVRPGSAWGRLTAPWLARAGQVLYATPDLELWVRAFRPDARFVPNPIPLPAPAATENLGRDVFVGVRFDAVKGPRHVIRTLVRLLEVRPQTTITLVDQGHDRALALAALGDRVSVIGYVAHETLPAVLAGHRVAIGQMAVGALGNYELEAMAAGLPTVASFRYPAAYAAPPPVIDAGSPEGTAERLAALLDDEPARARLGAESRAWVAEHHGTAAIVDEVLAVYREVLAR